MSRLKDLQQSFAAALVDAAAPVPSALAKNGKTATRRFNVYRNNVYASLIDVLAGRFPVVVRVVGEDFFRALARIYVEQEPPRSPVLLRYGAGFPDFVAGFAPAGSVPYLADVARLEWAWAEAYHATDAQPLSLGSLAAVGQDAEVVGLRLHPSLQLVGSIHPVISIWELNAGRSDQAPTRLPPGGEDALVLRPYLEVQVRKLPPGGLHFIQALRAEQSIGAAAITALEAAPGFDLAANLAGLMQSGAIVGLIPNSAGPNP
ncbi:MAG: HvfC/BufC N-terminal domain-containing protein [Methyloceanibacter sp.]|uniref:HvfC/BufC N-terminal domain-containing protein n=1 Tax=Methyloceanibacter sp. TaxID=1965321 RepID=UPI003D9B38A3